MVQVSDTGSVFQLFEASELNAASACCLTGGFWRLHHGTEGLRYILARCDLKTIVQQLDLVERFDWSRGTAHVLTVYQRSSSCDKYNVIQAWQTIWEAIVLNFILILLTQIIISSFLYQFSKQSYRKLHRGQEVKQNNKIRHWAGNKNNCQKINKTTTK